MTLVSNDQQTIIRTARRDHPCSCHLSKHNHTGRETSYGSHFCENVILRGEVYPEYLGESPGYQSGSRYCPDCRGDQLGEWISE